MANKTPSKLILEIADRGRQLMSSSSTGWAANVAANDYLEALQVIDDAMHKDPDDLMTRLCWVQCQLELESVPMTALSAPLEERFEQMKARPEVHSLAFSTFVKAGMSLYERKQFRLSSSMLERALEITEAGEEISNEHASAIEGFLISVLEEELQRVDSRRVKKKYVEGVTKRVEELKSRAKKKPAKAAPETKKRKKKKAFTAKSILTQGVDEEIESQPDTSSNQEDPAEEIPEEETPQERPILMPAERKRLSGLGIGIAMFVVIIGLLTLAWDVVFPSLDEELLQNRLAMHPQQMDRASMLLPDATTREPTEKERATQAQVTLDQVQSRLANIGSKNKKEKSTKESKPEPVAEAPDEPQAPIIDDLPKQENMASEMIRQKQDEIPLLDPKTLASTKVESLGGNSKSTVVKGLSVGRDGRVYGPAPGSKYSSKYETGDMKGLKGGSVSPQEVTQFRDPLLYKTIAPTEVLSAPSLLATSVAHLEADAKIQVVSRMGRWLEIRSLGGRRGYIFAQDAKRVPEGK